MADLTRIVKSPGVIGGDACIRGTRLAVWGLLESRRQGSTDDFILDMYPELTPEDLAAAWEYFSKNSLEVERALWENEACMLPKDVRDERTKMIVRGRKLGFNDEEIKDALYCAEEMARQMIRA